LIWRKAGIPLSGENETETERYGTEAHMQLILHNDDALHGYEAAEARVRKELDKGAMKGFLDAMTRIEVWIADENAQKHGANDKRCTMEAHPMNLKPVTVTHHAPTVNEAIAGAAEKLAKALEHTIKED